MPFGILYKECESGCIFLSNVKMRDLIFNNDIHIFLFIAAQYTFMKYLIVVEETIHNWAFAFLQRSKKNCIFAH